MHQITEIRRDSHHYHVRRLGLFGKQRRKGNTHVKHSKLTEIFNYYKLLQREANVIVDLGCVPGSWSAELVEQTEEGG